MQFPKQRCPLIMLYLLWVMYAGGLVMLTWEQRYWAAGVWLIALPASWTLYIRVFPAVSRYLGYGRVDDQPTLRLEPTPVKVVHYSAVGCTFCPIVERRLHALQLNLGFELVKVDVTLRPDLLLAKGIQSVPVVEVGERRLVGNATTAQLAALIQGAPLQTAYHPATQPV